MAEIDFDKLTPYEKGYAVYAVGALDDFPSVPELYDPTPEEREEYMRGQRAAVLDAQDVDDG